MDTKIQKNNSLDSPSGQLSSVSQGSLADVGVFIILSGVIILPFCVFIGGLAFAYFIPEIDASGLPWLMPLGFFPGSLYTFLALQLIRRRQKNKPISLFRSQGLQYIMSNIISLLLIGLTLGVLAAFG